MFLTSDINFNIITDFIYSNEKVIAIVGSIIVMLIIMITIGMYFKNADPLKPKGRIIIMFEHLMEYFTNYTGDIVGEKRAKSFTPFTMLIFLTIFTTNTAGLLVLQDAAFVDPIYSFSWSISMFVLWNVYAIIKLGPLKVIKNIGTPVFLTPLNLIGMITKPLSMALRLLGNITAGGIIMLGFWMLPNLVFNLISEFNFFGSGILGILFGIVVTVIGAALSGYFSLFGPYIQSIVFSTLTMSNFQETIEQLDEEDEVEVI